MVMSVYIIIVQVRLVYSRLGKVRSGKLGIILVSLV
jgi:hypothetical protein